MRELLKIKNVIKLQMNESKEEREIFYREEVSMMVIGTRSG